MKGKSNWWRKNAGQSMVEFALVTPMFFLMVFGIIDFGRVLFTQLTLQNAMRQAARLAVTGNTLANPTSNSGQQLSRVNSIKLAAQKAAAGINVSNIQISSAQGGVGSAGGPLDTVTIAMTSNLQLITPLIGHFFGTNDTYQFTVQATFRNEPFLPSQTN